MEPASILALVSVSLTIAHRLGATTRDVYDLYKTMKGITNSLELISSRNLIIRAALNQLKQWCSTALAKERLSSELSKALETALKTCNTVMEGISRRLSCVQKSRMIFARAKYVWIQRDLKDDADRLDGQISTLHFLVSILQLPQPRYDMRRSASFFEMQQVVRRAASDASTYVDFTQDNRDAYPVLSYAVVCVSKALDSTLATSSSTTATGPTFGASTTSSNIVPNLHVKISELAKELAEDSTDDYAVARLSIGLLDAVKQGNIPCMNSLLQDGADINGTIKGASLLLLCTLDNDLNGVKHLIANGAQLDSPSMPAVVLVLAAAACHNRSILDLLLSRAGHIGDILPEENSSYFFIGIVHPSLIRSSNTIPKGFTVLHVASQIGDLVMAAMILNRGGELNRQDAVGMTALHIAAMHNNADIVSMLLEKNADLTIPSFDFGNLPLHLAVYHNSIDAGKILIRKGADTNTYSRDSISALHLAVHKGLFSFATLLIENGSDVQSVDKEKNTPLHLAASQNLFEVATFLLSNGADPNFVNERWWTPLHCAAHDDSHDVAALLLKHGANVRFEDLTGLTPFHVAMGRNAVRSVVLLVANGAKVNGRDHNDAQGLHCAAMNGCLDAAKKAIELEANIRCVDKKGRTPLHTAARFDSDGIASYLIANGAHVHCRAKKGRTALHYAAKYNSMKVASVLIESDSNINSVDACGFTALHHAALKDSNKVARALVEHGADINSQHMQERLTPLHVAAREDSIKVARLLLENGADLLRTCAKGWTPFEMASHHTVSKEMLEILDPFEPEKTGGNNVSQPVSRSSTDLGMYPSAAIGVAFTGTIFHAFRWWMGSRR